MKFIVLLFLLLSSVCASAVSGAAGPYRIELRTDPEIVPVGRARLLISLKDERGKPVAGATIKTLVQMPGMVMGEREEVASPAGAGMYNARAVFAMSGGYEARLQVTGPLGDASTSIPLQTGRSSGAADTGFSWTPVLIGLALVAGFVLILRQVKRTGQAVNWRGMFSRQVLLSLLLLGAALAVAVWAVNSMRRRGAMTPLEAQIMDMNAPAPEGVLPVRLATVESKPFTASVTYSGQAVGFVEQEVVPRVTGAIVWMPTYVGTRVKKGQVLARLDTSQLDPMVGEKAAGVSTAQQGVGVAAMEYQQALNAVTQARAEVSMVQGEVAESNAMLEAAKQSRGSAESALAAAESEVQVMKADLAAEQADLRYQQQELQRMQTLFAQGAISKDEWQRAQADAGRAEAQVDKAREAVNRASAGVGSARAELRKVDAEIAAARKKVQQTEAGVRAKQASVRTAQSAAAAAKGRIGQSQAGVAEAAAGLRGATTQRGYAELRAEVDGVVTERVVSPGVVVAPGQTILRVAQISPIRLQANVPEADLARIRSGALVRVSRQGSKGKAVLATVTSVSPAVDPNSRTGVVEALWENSHNEFLPGQFVSMEISIGDETPSAVVPAAAVQSEGNQSFVWVAEASSNNNYTVSRHLVTVRSRAEDSVAIESGVTAGQQVVLAPSPTLVAGNRVRPMDTATGFTEPAMLEQTVEISAAGYKPPSITVPANKPFKITFIRRDEENCGTEVIFPDLGIRKELPLNKPVVVDIPPQPAGKELKFTCPMDMLQGKAVAR